VEKNVKVMLFPTWQLSDAMVVGVCIATGVFS
jgi:hypothetical protein